MRPDSVRCGLHFQPPLSHQPHALQRHTARRGLHYLDEKAVQRIEHHGVAKPLDLNEPLII